jgi:hypothetical protein
MYQQFYVQQFYVLPKQCIYMFCVDLRKKQRLFPYTTLTGWFFDAFANLQKATISFLMSVCLCTWHTQLGSYLTCFHEILYLSTLRKSVEKIQLSWKSNKNNGYFTWRPIHIFNNISLTSKKKKKVSNKTCRENQHTLFVFSNVFTKIAPFMR